MSPSVDWLAAALPLPYRARPPQIVLGAGAVLRSAPAPPSRRSTAVSSSGCCSWCSPARPRGSPCGRRASGLRSSEEMLAACAAGLAVAGASQGDRRSTATP